MGKLIFDYKDGDLIHIISEQTAIDMDGHLMMKMNDNREPSIPQTVSLPIDSYNW